MPEFTYIADKDSYFARPIPGQPGSVEHMFYCRGVDLPENVPHGCNPRFQNIEKGVYQKVVASYCDLNDMTFHLKNKGITVLANSVLSTYGRDGRMVLTVNIPTELGNVDGNHTYQIAQKHKGTNPNQLVPIIIKEAIKPSLIPPVAEGLNTSVQLTTATMADHSGLFFPVREALKNQPYYEWIGWRDNQMNISAASKTLVTLMWVCNPILFAEDKSAKLPSWIYTRGTAVFEKGFYDPRNDSIRRVMLLLAPVLPKIIEVFMHINETVPKYIPKKRRKSTTPLHSAGERGTCLDVSSLCLRTTPRMFHDPEDKTRYLQLRESYAMVVISGLRSLLHRPHPDGSIEWKVPEDRIIPIVDASLKKIYKDLVLELKNARGDHNQTPKTASLWSAVESTMGYTWMKMKDNEKQDLWYIPGEYQESP